MAVELGTAYISLLPSTDSFVPSMKDVIGKASGAAGSGGKGLGGVMFGAMAGVGMTLMNKAIGTITSSIGGAIARVDALNAFPRVMQNLGYSADDASTSIKKIDDGLAGLPTTIDQMAGVVQVMAPLTSSLDEATDISLALNNALLAGGKAAGDQANAMDSYVTMLSAGTVDMQRWRSMVSAMPGQVDQLAKSLLGAEANQQDLYDAMKSGEITFDDFNNELLKLNNEGLDGFASFSQQAKDATGGIETSLTNLKTAITKNLANAIQALEPIISPVIESLRNFANMAGGWVVEKLGALMDWFKQGNGAFGRFGEVFSELVPKVMELFQNFSPLSLIFEAVQPLLPQIADLFTRIGEALMKLVPPLLEGTRAFADALVPVITRLVEAILPPLIRIFESVVPVLEVVADAIMPLVNMIMDLLMPVIEALLPVVEVVFNTIADVIETVMQWVQGVIQVVTGIIEGDWEMVWEGIQNIFKGVWNSVVAILEGALDIIWAVLKAALKILNSLWQNAWEWIKTAFSDVWNAIVNFLKDAWTNIKNAVKTSIDWVKDKIDAVTSTIKSVWDTVWGAIKSFFVNIWDDIVDAGSRLFNSVKDKFVAVTDFIASIPDRILGFFAGIGTWLKDSGTALIQGFIDGITKAFEWAKSKVEDGLGAIRNLFPFSPAKEGPFSGRGWVANSGASIGEAFTSSLVDSLDDGKTDIAGELGGIHDEFDRFGSGSAGFSLSSASLATGSRSVTVRIGSRDFEGWMDERADVSVRRGVSAGSAGSVARELGFA